MRKRMKGWLLPYGVWYALAVWAVLGVVAGAVAGDVFNAVSCGVIAVGVGAVAVRSRVRWSRSGVKAARAEMMRLVDERSGPGAALLWLNRDAHLVFGADRSRVAGLRGRTLVVIDEDQLRDVGSAWGSGEGGKVALTDVSYRAHPVFPQVMRRTDGTTVLVTADDIEMADIPHGRVRWWRGYTGMVRTIRAGLAYADAAELAGVVAQFRDADPISRADPEGPEDQEAAS